MRRMARQQATIATDTSIYASGDQIGVLMTVPVLDPTFGARLVTVSVMDKSKQKSALDLYFFDRSVTVAADQAAASFSDADAVFTLGVVNILAVDYDDNAANSVATVNLSPSLPLTANNRGRNTFMAVVSRGTPTYTGATDLVVSLNAEQDDE